MIDWDKIGKMYESGKYTLKELGKIVNRDRSTVGSHMRRRGYKNPNIKNKTVDTDRVKEAFRKEGYALIDKKYKNNLTKMECMCDKGHTVQLSWTDWNAGRRCKVCNPYNKSRITTEQMQSDLKKEGYSMIGEYVNVEVPINIICPNGHNLKLTRRQWVAGKRCHHCSGSTLSTTYIKEQMEKEGYTLKSEYSDVNKKMNALCPEGHSIKLSWNQWRSGTRCYECVKTGKVGMYNLTTAYRHSHKWKKIPAELYIVELYSHDEVFVKIGITRRSTKIRMSNIPYNYNIIYTLDGNLFEIVNLEAKLHKHLHSYRYTPKIKFGGDNECFTRLALESIDIKEVKAKLNGIQNTRGDLGVKDKTAWDYVSLSDPETVKALLFFRSELDPTYNTGERSLLESGFDLANIDDNVHLTYIDLQSVIDKVKFTKRQLEYLDLMEQGYNVEDIANKLNIKNSEHAEVVVNNICKKISDKNKELWSSWVRWDYRRVETRYKQCSKCKDFKPMVYEYFRKHTNTKDGFQSRCRECE